MPFLSFAQGSLVQVFAKEVAGEEEEYWEAEVGGACSAHEGRVTVVMCCPLTRRSAVVEALSRGPALLSSTSCATHLGMSWRTPQSWHRWSEISQMTPQPGTVGRLVWRKVGQRLKVGHRLRAEHRLRERHRLKVEQRLRVGRRLIERHKLKVKHRSRTKHRLRVEHRLRVS